MEQLLLQLVNEQAPQPYSDFDNLTLASYLVGETDFNKVVPRLKVNKNRYYFSNDSDLRKILHNLARDKEKILPPLGRYCRIIRHTRGLQPLFSFLANTVKSASTTPEIYAAGGLAPEELITDILDTLPEYWHIAPKLLGAKTYQQFFENIYTSHPEAFEKLARDGSKPGYALFAASYIYAMEPAAHAKLEDRIINLSKQLFSKNLDAGAFESITRESFFANCPHIKPLRKIKGTECDKHIMDMFYIAYTLQPSPPMLLDTISYLLLYSETTAAFTSFSNANRSINGIEHNKIFGALLPCVHKGTFPMAQFLARAGASLHIIKDILGEIRELAINNEDKVLKAIKITSLQSAIILLSPYWEKGLQMELLPVYEEKVIATIEKDDEVLRAYFRGKAGLPQRVPNTKVNVYVLSQIAAHMASYSKLPARLATFAISFDQWANIPNFFGSLIANINEYFDTDTVSNLVDEINIPDGEKITALVSATAGHYLTNPEPLLKQEARRLAKGNTALYEDAFKIAGADARAEILSMAYNQEPGYNPDWLLDCLGDSSKKVRDTAIALLTTRTELKPQIEELTKAKKKAIREATEKILANFNATGTTAGENNDFDALAYCIQNIPAKASKTIEWTDFETLPKVRLAASEDIADDRIIIGYIYTMVSQNEMALPRPAIMIREALNKTDLQALGLQLCHVWKNKGAVSKHRTVLALAAIDGDDNFVRELVKDITAWADASRGALAAEATRALALQGGSLALMTIDAFSKKFKNKQVKRVAEEAFKFAAEQLGIDPEVLGDRIVPNLGFDNRGEQIIDYGNRQFTATITPDLQISLKNDQGKAIKSLPAVGVTDDKEKATAARADFAAMKKSLKAVASLQCLRLEQALSNNRTWSKEAWTQLFVENPIMNMFAIGLVWGTYDKTGSLTTCFRYMEDGSFVTAEEEDFDLPEDAQVGLCHPLDLGDDLTAQWKQQLEDYEITQPVEQLARKVFLLPTDKKADAVTEFGGAVVYVISLWGKLQKMGWYRGSVADAGGFFNFYKEDAKQGLGVMLYFSGSYIGADHSEEVTVYDAVFYKAGTVQYGSYVYDEVKPEDRIPLYEVPARFYSEVCYDIERATASRIDTVEKWVKKY
ncbi:MAG: DUF4132 domain-containing protein [Defluviitaleaceae bacterium]|nr:DUF4132 domain-containing protein [Defluviitaleaceae bacterium]